jgi:hypothetical protein
VSKASKGHTVISNVSSLHTIGLGQYGVNDCLLPIDLCIHCGHVCRLWVIGGMLNAWLGLLCEGCGPVPSARDVESVFRCFRLDFIGSSSTLTGRCASITGRERGQVTSDQIGLGSLDCMRGTGYKGQYKFGNMAKATYDPRLWLVCHPRGGIANSSS